MTKNLLGDETSPYLLQHAANPVHWHPWGPDALARAKHEDKPILLSVGYAACHWCHVMAHESFENPAVATRMNELFVCIKVDREERPDLDTIYQHALMFLGQRGGWPLTMFLTPDGEPFWGGTYFPPESRHGLPGFPDVLAGVIQHYRDKPEAVTQNVATLRGALGEMAHSAAGAFITMATIDGAARRLVGEFDKVNGGIGGAPKFPNPSILELLWRGWRRTGDEELRDTVLLTLDRMSQGGIYDHLGGGYARYSTDAVWLVPHFEKMLYDNAQLMDLLTAAWQETQSPLYAARVAETAEWVLREMIAPGGGFAATLDADSEGVEGKFYVWEADQIDQALGDDAALFKRLYDVTPDGNWEGANILNRSHAAAPASAAEEAGLASSRALLLAARDGRVRPGWDDKVLADWNGLMIAAMANAGRVFQEPGWTAAAQTAFRFVCENMADGNRLYHSWRSGRARHAAMLEDYANMARAALVLHEVAGNDTYLQSARDWAAVLDLHYRDESQGGYFFTADDAEALIVRTKTANDDATPAGNGTMAAVLARLYFLTGDEIYRRNSEAVVAAFAGAAADNVFPLATLLNAAELLQSAAQIVIVGRRGEAGTEALMRAAFDVSTPNRVLMVIAPDAALPAGHPAFGKGQTAGAATAYVCVGQTCSLPLTDVAEIALCLPRSNEVR